MSKLTLMVCLSDFPTDDMLNASLQTGRHAIQFAEASRPNSILGRDGVTQLSDNAFLFDTTKAHSAFVQVCRAMTEKGHDYLLAQVETDDVVLVGWKETEKLKRLSTIGIRAQYI